jgi:hypothetical protein
MTDALSDAPAAYRARKRIDGVVVTFFDISKVVEGEEHRRTLVRGSITGSGYAAMVAVADGLRLQPAC